MRNYLFILAMLVPLTGHAAIQPYFQDIKLPTQRMIEKQSWAAPATASSTYLVITSNTTGPGSSIAAATVSTFSAQPDFSRNITLTNSGPGLVNGSSNNQKSCAVVATGLDYLGHSITETLTFAAAQSTVVTGSKAFQTLSSLAFPANCVAASSAIYYDVGVGTKLGMKRCMQDAAGYFHGASDGIKEVTAATIAADQSVVSGNTLIFNTAPNGAHNFDAYFMQDYKCLN